MLRVGRAFDAPLLRSDALRRRARRGVITVLNRERLEEVAGGGYGVPEAEYRRLIGDF